MVKKREKKVTQFYFRLAPNERKLIEMAALIDRRSTSDFIRIASVDKANEIIEAYKRKK